MPAFALYRLPYRQQCRLMVQTDGEPEELSTVFALSGKSGFAMAPFSIDSQHPLLVLRPDYSVSLLPHQLSASDGLPREVSELLAEVLHQPQQQENVRHGRRSHYAIDFANFHSHILEGEFSKVVLARCSCETNDGRWSAIELFTKACAAYPRMFVTLVSARRCGTWLMATPEVLLEGEDRTWRTMSLAGTMRLSDQQLTFDDPPSPLQHDDREMGWNVKNIQEQRFVSTYITESLEQVATDIEEKGPFTMRAGQLVHLRSDFTFTLPSEERLGELLHVLYPTPAVCGLPKEEARDFITHNEFAPRLYYSGFVGPLHTDNDGVPTPSDTAPYTDASTHLFVALRCMRITPHHYYLYAGGGLLADSEEATEWRETEDKMDTMRNLIKP